MAAAAAGESPGVRGEGGGRGWWRRRRRRRQRDAVARHAVAGTGAGLPPAARGRNRVRAHCLPRGRLPAAPVGLPALHTRLIPPQRRSPLAATTLPRVLRAGEEPP